jgi:hypothetical protein
MVVSERSAWRAVVLGLATWVVIGGLGLPAPGPSERPVEIRRIALTGTDAGSDVEWFTAEGDRARRADRRQPAQPGWRTTTELPHGTQLVGFDWEGDADVELEIRTSDGTGWEPWTELHPDHGMGEEGVEPTHPTLGPVWIGNGVERVQLRVAHGTLPELTLHAIEVGEPQRGRLEAPSASAAIPMPGIISRAEWGARPWNPNGNPDCSSQPAVAKARYAIVHHTVNANDYSAAEAYSLIRGIQAFHIDANGWCDIAYNLLVDRFGRIFEGRAGGVDKGVIGGHARGFNTGSIGVSMLGTYTSVAPPAAMEDAIGRLLTWKFAHHGIDAGGSVWVTSRCPESSCKYQEPEVVLLPTIIGHRDVGVTSCPGGAAYPMLARLRSRVAPAVLKSGPFHPLPGWAPQSTAPKVLSLDAWGGLHPAGGASSVPHGYFPWSAIARGVAGTAAAGYVVDGSGGLHPYGSAPPASGATGWWPGQDLVRGIALASSSSGYVLDHWGGLHPFGGAPRLGGTGYWPGWDIARDVVTLPGGLGGYVLDGWGGLHRFGAAPAPFGGPYWSGWDIARAVAMRPDGPGGYVLDAWGGVHAFGGAPALAAPGYRPGADVFRDLVILSGGRGYAVDLDGVIWPVGSAPTVEHSLTWAGFAAARGLVGG